MITFNDGVTTKPATYTINASTIGKSGLPTLHYSTQSLGSLLILYPQAGASKIEIKPTNGIATQIFGNFFNQKGPDRIDASNADAQAFITGSTGNDTIFASPAGGFVSGGGGSPTIHTLNDYTMSIMCAPSGKRGTAYVTTLDLVSNCKHVHRSKPVVVLKDVRFSPRHVPSGARLTLKLPSYVQGTLKLTFQLANCSGGSRCNQGVVSKRVRGGTTTLRLSPKARKGGHEVQLRKGRYRVGAQLTSRGRHSKTRHLSLVIG
jgi:hypothetical protein